MPIRRTSNQKCAGMVNHVNRDYAHSEEEPGVKNVMEPNDDATKSNMEDKDISDDSVNFVTSTPVKRKGEL